MPACEYSPWTHRPSGCRWPFSTVATADVIRERAGNASSERILPLTAKVLAEAGTSLGELDGIAYGAGPGSFTGVRIACGVVQGLAFGADLPVFGVPTLVRSRTPRGGCTVGGGCSPASMPACARSTWRRTCETTTDGRASVIRSCASPTTYALDAGVWHGAGDGFAAYPELAARLRLAGADASIIPDAQSIAEWAWPHLAAGRACGRRTRSRCTCATASRSPPPSAWPGCVFSLPAMASLPKPPELAPVRWRPLAAHDLPVVAALEARIHAAPWSERNFRDALAAGYSARVGLRAERIVAYGVLMLGPGEAQLLNLSVVPDARRMGLGRALLYQFIDDARRLYAEQLFLEVRVSNRSAIALYEAAGFMSIARRVAYYPPANPGANREDALVMRCALGMLPGVPAAP